MTAADALPGDMPGLRAAALALIAERDELLRRVERMRQIIRQFQRAQFGRHSERLDPDQLQLALEEREIVSAQTQAAAEKQATTPRPRAAPGNRKSLPAHLPRVEVVIEPETTSCPCCGGAMHVIGEEKSERLDVIPAQHRVLVTRRPKYGCRSCAGAVVQAPATERLIRSGLPTEALVAHVLVSKYAWHLPLYRQAQILLTQGIDIERSVLAFWVGYAAAELMPLWRRLREILLGSPRLFVDETRAPVLDPGRGRTKSGYFWSIARDDSAWCGDTGPPGVAYTYAPGRGAEHAATLLAGYRGIVQCDGYAAYKQVARRGRAGNAVSLAFCWSHPWTAPRAQGNFDVCGDRGRVQPSIRPCVAALAAAGPDDIRSSVPYHWSGLRVRCDQRVRRSWVRPDLPSTTVLPAHSSWGVVDLCGRRCPRRLKLTVVGQHCPRGTGCFIGDCDGCDIGRPPHQQPGQPLPALAPPSGQRPRTVDQQRSNIAVAAFADAAKDLAIAARTLFRHEAEPSGKMTARAKALGIVDRENQRRCRHCTHPRYRHQATAGIGLLGPRLESGFGLSDPDLGLADLFEEQNQHRARRIGQCARLGITHQVGQFADVAGAATRHKAEFGKMTAHRVDQLGALAQQQRPGSVQHHRRLLLDRLDRNKPHVRPDHRLADPFGISRVVLIGFDKRTNVLRRDQPDIVAETLQLTRPVMTARAGLNANQRPRNASKEHDDFSSAKPPAQHAPSFGIGAVHLKHVFRDIETDDGRIGHLSPPVAAAILGDCAGNGYRVSGGPCHHVRRKFFDVHAANGSVIAKQALDRIGELYGVEKTIAGRPSEQRRAERHKRSKPIAEAMRSWAEATLPKLSRKSELAKALRYMRARWKALLRCFDDGRLALDNNPAERALRCVALGRKNYLFAGSDAGGRRAAALYSLLETAKLNGLNPQHYLADLLTRIADHPARQIAELLPWHWQPANLDRAAA